MAFSTLGIRAWGSPIQGGDSWTVFMSRVTDKSGMYPLTCLDALFKIKKLIDWDEVSNIEIWSDCATNFRCRALLRYFAIDVLQQHDRVLRTTCQFGCEHHMKAAVDGLFARLSKTRRNYSLKSSLFDISDVVSAYEQDFSARQAIHPTIPFERFLEHLPKKKADCMKPTFAWSSLPCGIKSCYSWVWTRADLRRQSLFGRIPKHLELTGVFGRCLMVGGETIAPHGAYHPILDPATATVDPDPPAAEPEPEPEAITHLTKIHLGWKTSYRASEPEKEAPDRHVQCWSKKGVELVGIDKKFAEPTRHLGKQQLRESEAARSTKVRVKAKAEAAFFAKQRRKPRGADP